MLPLVARIRSGVIIIPGLLILAAVSGCASTPNAAIGTRAISYNIRLDIEVDGDDQWPNRRHDVAALLKFYAADVFGLQEVRLHQLQQLKEDMDRFTFVGVGRDDGLERGEFSPVAFARQRYALTDQGTFWLSETPQQPSVGFDAAFPRLVTWVRLDDRRSGHKALVLNTHWDHVGVEARLASGRIVKAWIDAHREPCENVILLGDFNAVPDDAPIKLLTGATSTTLVRALTKSESAPFGPAGTFNEFDILSARSAPIDHIFVSENVRVIRHGVITQHNEGRLPSDHYPVLADIELAGCEMR